MNTAQTAERQRRLDRLQREALALRLDEIDPDWPSKFLSTDQASRFYQAELKERETRQ